MSVIYSYVQYDMFNNTRIIVGLLIKNGYVGHFYFVKKKRTKQIRNFFIEKKITIVDVTIVSCIH